jgi:serine phosphatase RsbU (regulator of sigma subunit)
VIEGKNVEGEMYGKKRMRKSVEGSLAGGPKKVVETLMAEFLQHNEGKELDDDVTLAVATFMGNT